MLRVFVNKRILLHRAYATKPTAVLRNGLGRLDTFARRHIGPNPKEIDRMLNSLNLDSLSQLVEKAIPASVRTSRPLNLEPALTESELIERAQQLAQSNTPVKSLLGQGYYNTLVPAVIQRNLLENPQWYTQYTPYQAEISQGRLESLLNFQTLTVELTGLEVANSSLLDEATAAAEAMIMCYSQLKAGKKRNVFWVDEGVYAQTLSCLKGRAEGFGIKVVTGKLAESDWKAYENELCGVLVQYPNVNGHIETQLHQVFEQVHEKGALVVCAADPLALLLLTPPGDLGADICLGSMQRFGVPLGFGGPHAAYFACRQKFQRRMPGRIVGQSRDSQGELAFRLALQTREQHIKREKATSNICTSQALLANMSAMYALYHGPEGLRDIAERVHLLASSFANGVIAGGYSLQSDYLFDTVVVNCNAEKVKEITKKCLDRGFNVRPLESGVALSFDETLLQRDVESLLEAFGCKWNEELISSKALLPPGLERKSAALKNPIFSKISSETDMLRYLAELQKKDYSLADGMIPLGSCTMKLNATAEMMPLSWPGFTEVHPFAPADQVQGYQRLVDELESDLEELTGFDSISMQPNSGAQGEYTGLKVIKAFHRNQQQSQRNLCLIPVSAHGTNPASAVMTGMQVVPIKCSTSTGTLDLNDLAKKIDSVGADKIAAMMITYPSTFGVFEETVIKACELVHQCGGQVYMDGANLNAQLGLCRPAEIGADVCHLNLHKTFCIPHGGGGPGMGPIGVKQHLAPYLPSHPLFPINENSLAIDNVSASPYGSPLILPVSWAYIKMMGAAGLTRATEVALLNANYMKQLLSSHFKILYTNEQGMVAHEFIVDVREFQRLGIQAVDIAKRLQDYGFHAPTLSWPVQGTLMIEPTESEPLEEMDRFCEAMIQIRREIGQIEEGIWPKDDNPLKAAPHSLGMLMKNEWNHPYSRETAAFPLPYLRRRKFLPAIGRVDDTFGDLNLVLTR